jgi:hypothetical protein
MQQDNYKESILKRIYFSDIFCRFSKLIGEKTTMIESVTFFTASIILLRI